MIAIVWGMHAWQTRHMLETDGSVKIAETYLIGLDGKVNTLFSDSSDMRPTLVYFFAPWCAVCKYSIGNLTDLDESKLNIVRIALDYRTAEDVIDFVDMTNTAGPVLLGDRATKARFAVNGYPSYYLLDDRQRVIGKSMGYSSEWGMKLKSFLLNPRQTSVNKPVVVL